MENKSKKNESKTDLELTEKKATKIKDESAHIFDALISGDVTRSQSDEIKGNESKQNNDSEKKANPAPLGLFAFGMTTLLLNLCNVGALSFNSMIIAMGLCVGGLAQIIVGLIEFRHANNFGGTAFISYGVFWWSFALIKLFTKGSMNMQLSNSLAPSSLAMGCYLLVWALFSAVLFVGTLKHNTISKIVFGSLTLLFLLLAIGDFAHSSVITKIAGTVGIICAMSAIYSASGQIINEQFGKKILPL